MEMFEGKTRLNFAVLHAGAPCCGMNAGKILYLGSCLLDKEMYERRYFQDHWTRLALIDQRINVIGSRLGLFEQLV